LLSLALQLFLFYLGQHLFRLKPYYAPAAAADQAEKGCRQERFFPPHCCHFLSLPHVLSHGLSGSISNIRFSQFQEGQGLMVYQASQATEKPTTETEKSI